MKKIWNYRDFILNKIFNDFEMSYKNSFLGFIWPIFSPLVMIIIYMVVFSQVFKAKISTNDSGLEYGIYLCTGILAWNLFSEIVLKTQNTFLESASLIKKIPFPKICLVIAALGVPVIRFFISFFLLLVILSVIHPFSVYLVLTAIVIIIMIVIIASSLGLIFGLFNIYFRDAAHVLSLLLPFWFWLTPIVYPLSSLSPQAQKLIQLNPLTPLVGALQNIFVGSKPVDWGDTLSLVVALTIIFLPLIAAYLFNKNSQEMVDEL